MLKRRKARLSAERLPSPLPPPPPPRRRRPPPSLLLPSHALFTRSHLIRHPGSTWSDVPDLPKAAVAALDAGFALFTTRLLEVQRSSDGETTKLLVQLQDGLQVESVVMEYDNTGGCRAGGCCRCSCRCHCTTGALSDGRPIARE